MFEIGDMVQVKPVNLIEKRYESEDIYGDILFRETTSDLSFVSSMLDEQLSIMTIKDITNTIYGRRYRLGDWWYGEDWIELVKKG